ncbi:MAG: endonuclease/exonuclease/phosphatase family protein [Promethearchaeota archaeon]
MNSVKKHVNADFLNIAFASLMFLFFLQLFSDFVESIYIFCLMTLSLNENVLTVLFLLAPILLLFFGRKQMPRLAIMIINGVMVLARVLEPMFDTKLRMIVSGLGVGCFMMLFPTLLSLRKTQNKPHSGLNLGISMVIAVCVSILFRILNSSIDISTFSWFQAIGWVLGGIEILLLLDALQYIKIFTRKQAPEAEGEVSPEEKPPDTHSSKKRGKVFGATIGFSSVFVLIYFVFSSPTMLTRWTEANFLLITIFMIIVFCATVVILIIKPGLIAHIKSWIIWVWNGLFTLSLVGTILINQVIFPSALDSYPIVVSQPTFFQLVPPFLLILLSPILFIDLILFLTNLIQSKPRLPRLAASFTLSGGFYMLLFIFSLIFTSTWGFIPIIGNYFRDQFWSVFLAVSVVISGLMFFHRKGDIKIRFPTYNKNLKISTFIFLGIMLSGTIMGASLLGAHPPTITGTPTSMKILTYNLQQGVNDTASKNYDGQLEVIRQIDADIIGLQESSKIAGNSDVVQYFANKLDMYSYFGPHGVTGTTGVALLSKYPILNAKTLYHYNINNDNKQTATIEAEIVVGTKTFTVYVTHTFGSQHAKSLLVNDTLLRAQGKSDVLFIGDFNFRQYSEAYNATTAGLFPLVDAWLDQWGPTAIDDLGLNATRRIDHIFFSPDLTSDITECRYADWTDDPHDRQSDHPACWATFQW